MSYSGFLCFIEWMTKTLLVLNQRGPLTLCVVCFSGNHYVLICHGVRRDKRPEESIPFFVLRIEEMNKKSHKNDGFPVPLSPFGVSCVT